MLAKIIKGSRGVPTNLKHISTNTPCTACSQGKFIARPFKSKLPTNIPEFLANISADVCGPINPASGPFRYFMPMICASSKWSNLSLLVTRNMVFPRILSQVLRLKAQFPEHPIRVIRVDNAGEFTSPPFDDFCTSMGIEVQYPVPHVHSQNGLAEAVIIRLQLIARPLLMHSQLPTSAWGHAVLHANALIQYRPSTFNDLSPH